VTRELALIKKATDSGRLDIAGEEEGVTLGVSGSVGTGEIKATYVRDEGESKVLLTQYLSHLIS
jgi:hypothetical protein